VARDLVEVVATLDHPRDLVWTVVSDLGSYPRYVSEVSWCEPKSRGPARAGSHYDMRFSIGEGPVRRNDVEILVHRPSEYLVLVSMQWPDGHLMVRLTPLGPERTELQLTIAPPKGRPLTITAAKWMRKRARKAIQLVNDHLSGVPIATSTTHERRRVSVRKVLAEAGMLSPRHPWAMLRQLYALTQRDATVVGAYRVSTALAPHDEAISDDKGTVTFADVDRRTDRLANALAKHGVREGLYVALWCRNHAALLESVIACGKVGAHALVLNTDLPATQATDALRRYRPVVMLVDDEFAAPCPGSPALLRIRTWGAGKPAIEELIERGSTQPVRVPSAKGKITVLTSGVPNNPRGTRRRNPHALRPIAAVLSRIPLRAGERMLVAAPLFYSWAGLAAIQLGMPLHAKLVLQRHFDAEQTLRLVQTHRCTSLFTTPAVLAQILALPPLVIRKYDTSSLRVVATSGPALLPELVTEFMDEFGDVLYHLYGSAELSWASIAGPNHLRAAPTTAGRPPAGTRIEIQDTWGRPVPPGVVGHICVGDDVFGGYSGRNTGELLRTGDRGYVDADGRLFVAAPVAPLENTLPGPLERLLLTLPQVADAAVVTVSDRELDQRLAAYVALRPGATLTAAAVRDFLGTQLPGLAVLRDVIFVDSLTRNATTKVMRRLLSTPKLAE
jgi:acyl-coenzyme A synthetase/AMP-(fatty) acid ligase